MLGRFLEISIHCPEVRDSLVFYQRLGLQMADTNDIWPHQYAVLTDGRVALGLHGYDFPSPSLTWVHPGISGYAPELSDAGIEFEFLKIGEEEFNEAGFRDPDGQMVTMLEARTFSPSPEPHKRPVAGYFREYRFPVRSVAASSSFWESLGFVAMRNGDEERSPAVLTSDGIDLCVFEGRPSPPVLVYETPDLAAATAELVARGIAGQQTADELTDGAGLELTAPEGTRLLILEETI